MTKLYNEFRNNFLVCDKILKAANNIPEIKEYLKSRNIGQVVFLLTFVEICMPHEYKQLAKHGAKYVEQPLYGESSVTSPERALLIELTDGLVYGGYYDFQVPNSYIKNEIRKFIDKYLCDKKEICDLINPYSTQEEEWINAIEELNVPVIESKWCDMVFMVLQYDLNDTSKEKQIWRQNKFSALLDFALFKIEKGEWDINKLFSLFENGLHLDRIISAQNGMMQVLWNKLQKVNIDSKFSQETIDTMFRFSHHYSYSRISSVYLLAHYLIPSSIKNDETKNIQECMLDSQNYFTYNIGIFLDKFERVIPNFALSKGDWYDKLKEFTCAINDTLIQYKIAEYPDVRISIASMLDSADEFLALDRILMLVQNTSSDNLQKNISNNKFISMAVNQNNIDKKIDYFEKILYDKKYEAKTNNPLDQQFLDFFRQLQKAQGIVLTENQFIRLNKLVSKYAELNYVSSLPYRRTLIELNKK